MPPRGGGRGRGRGFGRGGPAAPEPDVPAGPQAQKLLESEQAKAHAMLAERTVVLDTSACAFPDDLGVMFGAAVWEDPELKASKDHLNTVKSRLDDMQNRYERPTRRACTSRHKATHARAGGFGAFAETERGGMPGEKQVHIKTMQP
eukprot:352199-Chlamydomonas_euryale.AAC.11